MGKLLLSVFALIVLALAGGALFLAYWDVPAPTAKVEKTLPDARFPK
jgi:hypothetical protein